MMNRRQMLMMLSAEPGGLPADYLQVEYLQSTGTQYIDTGYYPNINTEWYVDFSDFTKTDAYYSPGGNSVTGSALGLFSNNKGSRVYTHFGNKRDIQYSGSNNEWVDRTKITISKSGVVSNGTQVLTYSGTTFGTSPYTFTLFALRQVSDGAVIRYADMKLYETIISESGTEVHHLVPCIRISDSKPGMYDLVGRQFYVNAGTGEFVVGWYVDDGLVLNLDGAQKGNTADTWTDLVGGHAFGASNGVTFGTNYVELDSNQNQYLSNTSFTVPSSSDGTIEIAFSGFSSRSTIIVFYPSSGGLLAFGYYGSSENGIIWKTAGSGNTVKAISSSISIKTASINYDRAIIDGTLASKGSAQAWSNTNGTNFIGKRSNNTAYYKGKIYSIRIYNRRLTEEEILRNQRVDNYRYQLGLNI